MPTLACYLGQVAVLTLTLVFGCRAFAAGAATVGAWMVTVFIIVALAWDCSYTVTVKGSGNVVVGRCTGE